MDKWAFGLSDAVAPGYSGINVDVKLDAPGATAKEVKELHEHVLKTSPVGSILSRPLKATTRLVA